MQRSNDFYLLHFQERYLLSLLIVKKKLALSLYSKKCITPFFFTSSHWESHYIETYDAEILTQKCLTIFLCAFLRLNKNNSLSIILTINFPKNPIEVFDVNIAWSLSNIYAFLSIFHLYL